METLTVEIAPKVYQSLRELARRAGKTPEDLSREILERVLQEQLRPSEAIRELLEVSGRLRPLGSTLQRRIIPGVTLEEVRRSLAKEGGPSLSELVMEQRGPKP